jgi:hypothetical protein
MSRSKQRSSRRHLAAVQPQPDQYRRKRLRASKWAGRPDLGIQGSSSNNNNRQQQASRASLEPQTLPEAEPIEVDTSDPETTDSEDFNPELAGVELLEVDDNNEPMLDEELDGRGDEEWEWDEEQFREALRHEARESGTSTLFLIIRAPQLTGVLGACFCGCFYYSGHQLPDEDVDILLAFAWKIKHQITSECYDDVPYAFPRSNTPSWKETEARAAKLSGLKPQWLDCCIGSCCAFVGRHAQLEQCPICEQARFDRRGKPRRRWLYLPLIPRFQAFMESPEVAVRNLYRSRHQHSPINTTDIFDGNHYCRLLQTYVTINGQPQPYKHFSDKRDFALGLSTDGFQIFKRRSKSAWPLFIFNYNLPPESRFLRENVLALGCIPGHAIDFDSFLWPLVEELLQLEAGIRTYDAHKKEFFTLHAYLLHVFGDIPAISLATRMKGHNGKCPCRHCMIRGVRIPGQARSPAYVPLHRAEHPDVNTVPDMPEVYDPLNLPMRTHAQFMEQARHVEAAPSQAEANRRAKECGIKGVPLLSKLSSISFPDSFPFDFMHLIWENLIKNLFQLWTGTFKTIDHEAYRISDEDWKKVGDESAASGRTIPLAFGPPPSNVATDKQSWTADSRSFWTLYLGPVLLNGRLRAPFFQHSVKLVKLLHRCLDFEYPAGRAQELREGFAEWVVDYERYVHSVMLRLQNLKVTLGSTTNTTLAVYLLVRLLFTRFCTSSTQFWLSDLFGVIGASLWSVTAVISFAR